MRDVAFKMVSVLPSMDHTFSSMVDLKEQSVLDHQVSVCECTVQKGVSLAY